MEQVKAGGMRKNYFIQKGFQIKFSALIFIASFAIGVIAVWTTYITTWNEVDSQIRSKELYKRIEVVFEKAIDEKTPAIINSIFVVEFAEIFDKVSTVLVARLFVGAFLLFVLSIFASHKIAGPLYRIENAAKSMNEGDLSVSIEKLRDGDELTELASTINGAIKKIRLLMERYREMACRLNELSVKMADYKQGGENASVESIRVLRELEVVSSQLVAEINYFKTKKDETKEINTSPAE
ncbi:MAG: HAMP domain-containing protein [Candidatus Omnitrophica bacterium]|nr:HAMP domain-containing protein [Candidatus Omnitrophota bacterium]